MSISDFIICLLVSLLYPATRHFDIQSRRPALTLKHPDNIPSYTVTNKAAFAQSLYESTKIRHLIFVRLDLVEVYGVGVFFAARGRFLAVVTNFSATNGASKGPSRDHEDAVSPQQPIVLRESLIGGHGFTSWGLL